MEMPQVNKEYVQHRIQMAEYKIDRFEGKIARISAHLEALNRERDSAMAILEYIGLSKTREDLLLDLFQYPGEYGQPEKLPSEYIDKLKEHAVRMEFSISFYQRCKGRRLEGVKFLKEDIERLRNIEQVRFQSWIFFAMNIDP